MPNKRSVLVVVLLLVVVNLTLGVRWYMASHSKKTSAACVDNLRQLVAAKEQWALVNHKTTNEIPGWDDLRLYLPQNPVCPQGGTYTLGRIGEPPTCSISGHDHSLPMN